MKMAREWWQSKTLWTATAPALVAALGGWAQGQLTWWQALAVAAGGFAAFGVRDAQARHEQAEQLRHEERMRAVGVAQTVARLQGGAPQAQEVITMHDIVQHVGRELMKDVARMVDQRVLGMAAQVGVPTGPLGDLPGPAVAERREAVVDRERFLAPERGTVPAEEPDGEAE